MSARHRGAAGSDRPPVGPGGRPAGTCPESVPAGLNSVAELGALRAAHLRHRTGEDVLEAATWAALAAVPTPARVLDVGAGTGNWYDSVRVIAGQACEYVGVDLQSAMVEALRSRIGGDARARTVLADGERLPADLGRFDWVGLHFVLPHVARPDQVLASAWRRVAPGGVLVAAGNGPAHLERWRQLHTEVLAELGLARQPAGVGSVPGPDPGEIAALLPPSAHPVVRRVPSGLAFPDLESALSYYGAVLWRRGLAPAEAADPTVRGRLLNAMQARLAERFDREGLFAVAGDTGFVIARRRPGRQPRARAR